MTDTSGEGSGGDLRALASRLFRQRQELGVSPIFLQSLRRNEVLEALAGAAAADSPPARPPRAPRARDGEPEGTGREPAGGGSLPVLPAEHAPLKELVAGCQRCGLSKVRSQVVFNDGVPDARLVVVGEAPGKNEDETGLPFVGAAGRLLDLLLMTIDLSREESVYICNVLKCRPPANRDPLPDEIEACRPILERQIEVVAPEVLLATGKFAAQWLAGSKAPLGKLRGRVYSYRGTPLVCTYHPAALLRNPGWTRATWEDFQLLRKVLDGGAPPSH